VVRTTDINGRLLQFAWWALATISFIPVVAIRIRLLGLRSNATKEITLMPPRSYCKASGLTSFWRGDQQTRGYSLRRERAISSSARTPKSVETLKNYIAFHKPNL
jgi:hypothetical protein